MLNKKTKLIIVSFILTVTFTASFYFADKALADDQQPILIQVYDTDLGTEAFEKLISYGNGGHQAIGDILGNAQNMETNPGIGFGIGSGGNGYRPSITIAVWTNALFDQSIGLATIKAYFNVPSTPVTTNGDCAIACNGTTQVEQIVTTTTTVASTTTLPEVIVPTQIAQSTAINSQISPTTTTTTIVESINVTSAYAPSALIEKIFTPITKPKIVNKTKKTIRKKTHATVKKSKQSSR
jgi:hypothetical protein